MSSTEADLGRKSVGIDPQTMVFVSFPQPQQTQVGVALGPTGRILAGGGSLRSQRIVEQILVAQTCKEMLTITKFASAGNRTRVTSMATRYSTTRPQMLIIYMSPSRGTSLPGIGKASVFQPSQNIVSPYFVVTSLVSLAEQIIAFWPPNNCVDQCFLRSGHNNSGFTH